jgi:tetrahydromethanopterin S-methyltransferase subunit A
LAIKKGIEEIAGKVCGFVLPISQEYYLGKGKRVAVCTLSSLDLLERLSESEDFMNRVALVGRLLSENKGIDAIVSFVTTHPTLREIVICGLEVRGHKAGQALLSLSRNGTDAEGRILGAVGAHPVLHSAQKDVDSFRKQVRVTDHIGTTDYSIIAGLVP